MKVTNVVIGLLLATVGMISVGCASQNKGPSSLRRIHFDYDSYSVRGDMMTILDANVKHLKKQRNTKITVEGHCDERGTNEYNYALGARRAESTKSYMVTQGINPKRLNTVSFGEDRPLKSGSGESVWYMNRRAEFVRR